MANSVRFKAQLDDQVSGKLGKIRDQFDRLGKSKGAMSVLQGVGMGAGISAWNLLGGAVSGAVDWLQQGVQGAIDEEAGIARLTAALQANAPAWANNTDAIEKGVKARTRMGFADDAVRDSLAKLVPVTKDVDKAFEVMNTAQDLARFKGISLGDATDALVKVEAGQYRMLKSLGIVLKDGATQTEALAAVQAVAAGQAEAYVETLGGKAERLKNATDDLGESIGGALIPYLSDLATVALGTGEMLDAAFGDAPMEEREDEVLDFGRALAGIIPGLGGLRDELDALDKSLDDHREEVNTTARTWDTGSERVGSAVYDMSSNVRTATRKIKLSFGSVTEWLLGEYNEDFDRAMGISEARLDLHNAKTDQERAEAYATLAELGAASQNDYARWMGALERLAGSTKGKVHEAYSAALEDLRKLRSAASKPITVTVTYRRNGRSTNYDEDPNAPGAATGGRRSGLTWVGEEGPELVDLGASSYVYTAAQSQRIAAGAAAGSSGTPVVVQLNLDGREVARVVDRHLYYEAARAPRSSYAG